MKIVVALVSILMILGTMAWTSIKQRHLPMLRARMTTLGLMLVGFVVLSIGTYIHHMKDQFLVGGTTLLSVGVLSTVFVALSISRTIRS